LQNVQEPEIAAKGSSRRNDASNEKNIRNESKESFGDSTAVAHGKYLEKGFFC
jgi:hypothetical protein